MLFLERQEQPICLVSHHGLEVNFPILADHLAQIGFEIPSEMTVRCGDSLQAFRDLQPGKTTKNAYNLGNLYQETFDLKIRDQCTAEDHAMALMKLIVHSGPKMRTWLNSNAVKELSEYRNIEHKPFAGENTFQTTNPLRWYERFSEDCH